MQSIKIAEKSFDEWAEMARDDPDSFEQMRLAAIEDYIGGVPCEQQERLRRLQWRIDQERRLARTPLNACIRLSRMMWDNLLGRGGLRERFAELGGVLQGGPGVPAGDTLDAQAEVVAFVRPAR
jgi:hypothetical protein